MNNPTHEETIEALRNRLEQAQQRIGELEGALRKIRDEEGRVCELYEICTHLSCMSSYNAWAYADQSLTPQQGGQ